MCLLDAAVIEALREFKMPNHKDLLEELVTLFLEEMPGALAQIKQALLSQDLVSTYKVAHKVKSSSQTVGARDLGTLLDNVEVMSRAGAPLDSLSTTFAEAEKEYQRVESALKSLLVAISS